MTDIDNVFDEFESNDDDVYYDPDQSSIVPEGTYPAKIVNLKKFNIVTQKGNEATIYKPVYRIDDGVLVASGTLVDDKGVFRYIPPKNKKGIRISGSGNVEYKRYLDKLDIPLIKEEIEGKTLYKLPTVSGASSGVPSDTLKLLSASVRMLSTPPSNTIVFLIFFCY